MGKRVTKAEANLYLALFIIGAPIAAVVLLYQAIGPYAFFGLIAAAVGLTVWYRIRQAKIQEEQARDRAQREADATEARRQELLRKYGDPQIVEKIMSGRVWQGQSAAQLRDALGNPADTDEKVMKTKRREVWKYGQTGRNRYALRVTLEQDVVVGWDEKA